MSAETYTLSKEGDFYVTEVLGQKFGFKKITFGQKNALSLACSKQLPTGEVIFDNLKFNTGLMEKTVFKFKDGLYTPMTVEEIDNLDNRIGDRLFQITQKMNLVQAVETVNL